MSHRRVKPSGVHKHHPTHADPEHRNQQDNIEHLISDFSSQPRRPGSGNTASNEVGTDPLLVKAAESPHKQHSAFVATRRSSKKKFP